MIPIKIRDTEVWVEYIMNDDGQIELSDIEIGNVNVYELIYPTSLFEHLEEACLDYWKRHER